MRILKILIIVSIFFLFSCNGDLLNDGIKALSKSGAPPNNSAQALSFIDTDLDEDEISGDLLITKAESENNILEYCLYWGTDENTKAEGQDIIIRLTADNTDKTYTFTQNTPVPPSVTHLLVYSSNIAGETATPTALDIPDRVFKMVKDINEGTDPSNPQNITEVAGTVYFRADNGSEGIELWKSDGTEDGTTIVKDINIFGNSYPNNLTNLNDVLYFTTDPFWDTSLWKSDGTEAGTTDIISFDAPNIPYSLTVWNNNIYFGADGDTNGIEPWVSDGTTSGTEILSIINGTGDSSPQFFTVAGDLMYFSADDGSNGRELYTTDGIVGGSTGMVTNINGGINDSNPSELTTLGNWLLFTAVDGTNGEELWRCREGVPAWTKLVSDIRTGATGAAPQNLTVVSNTIFFSADEDGGTSYGRELWKSNGIPDTMSGSTSRVKDIYPGSSDSNPDNLIALGDLLLFSADNGSDGVELWKSDGTEAGTTIVKDINTGDADPTNLTVIGDNLFFIASYSTFGKTLWISDGTEEGTQMIGDHGFISASGLAMCGEKLFFSGETAGEGKELWIYYVK